MNSANTISHSHLVIMAGGIGSRFWPMSTPERPKQFVDVLGTGRTFIQMTVDRFKGILPPENVWVVTSQAYKDIVAEQLPEVPQGNILLEPCRRNTAPCIAYAAWRIKSIDPKATIVVSPSDHLVLDTPEFQRVVKSAMDFASTSDAIVTLGMKPTRPETGYGYIQTDMSCPSARNKEIYRVDAFREKPDLATAEKYIRKPNMLWNAGIFIWNVSTIVNALRVYAPEINEVFENLLPLYGTDKEQDAINENFPKCESISVDYAILEKSEEIYCFPASFGWSDLGTWGSLRENVSRDNNGNAVIGDNVQTYETRDCVIHCSEERRVVVQGLDGYIVAEKDNTLLICKLSEEQRIKQFSE
ncbi:MAG: mannose-1-phosphate guanylyltransferase [Bacteroidaceae bacterium]|nr:mannose-1-phosphate guanylyltransferase [Bacteroidaceae bacterium]MBQ8274001.1 mannose-1-phosphate guanylyltransferase [Bacteroidaceae bacterium]MBR3982546.1 mannose-1-phosphate guanylyltransferase [Bacteroidaceae bacterium]MEE1288037.1 mannose-1-phosphate guanylyltransferase [Bacteroidaceae bacterium]